MSYPGKIKFSKADSLFHKAYTAHHAGKLDEAEAAYRKALRRTPTDLETLYLLGTVCSQRGKGDEAVMYLQRALAIKPDYVEALNNLGLTLKEQDKSEEAITYYQRAVALKPDYADAHANLANVFESLDRLDEAEAYARKALQLNPNLANAYYNLGLVLKKRDRFEEAAQCFLRGLELAPDLLPAYEELGSIYKIWGRMEQALACFDRGLSMRSDSFGLHNNRATVLEELGRFDEALVEYERAIELNPEDKTAMWNMAYFFLRQGILDRGWDLHELRLRKDGQVLMRFPFPNWDGSSLEGKTVLIFAEQGLGDEIFYASCIPDIIAQAGHCVIECDRRLAPLFARSFPFATIQGGDRLDIGWLLTMPNFDVQSPVGSLPRFIRRTFDSFPKTPSYLVPDPARVEYWRSRVATLGTELKVGICWRSSVAKGERHKQYSQLTQWGAVFSVPGVRFINLQYDECSDELKEVEDKFGVTVTNFPDIDLRNDIDDSAALMKSLDLVISAPTAVVEIAASVGVEVFRLDAYGKPMDAFGTDHSPWHPTLKLFVQLTRDDWETPLALVAEALKDRALTIANAGEYVQLSSGVEIAVNGSLEDLSTYVLKEQHRWFDPEYEFVLGLAQGDMSIVDVGAGVGQYAIPLAQRIPSGKLWAITHTAAETNLHMKSRARNRLEKCFNITIADQELSLDAEMDKHGLDDIVLVRLARDLCNRDFLDRGKRFFSTNSPLLMFGIRPGADFDAEVAEWLIANGYDLYRLVPGLCLLVPLVSVTEMDSYSLNLFACKQEQAESLERKGVLIRQVHTLNSLPGADSRYWQEYFRGLPCATDMLAGWLSLQQKEKDWEVYWMALNSFAMAKDERRDGAERYACLQAVVGILGTLVQEQANLPRLLSLCRALTEIGKREAAVNLLNQVCSLLHSGMPRLLNEPSLPLAEKFALMNPGDKAAEWVVAMILEQRENLRAFSTFFTGQESAPVLAEIRASGFFTEEIDRRISLIQMRHGTMT